MSGGPRMIRKGICGRYPKGSFEIRAPLDFLPGMLALGKCVPQREVAPKPRGTRIRCEYTRDGPKHGIRKAERLGMHSARRLAARSIQASRQLRAAARSRSVALISVSPIF